MWIPADPPWAAGGRKIWNRQCRPDAAVRHAPGKDTQIPPRSCPPPGGPQFQGQPSGRHAKQLLPALVASRRDADGVVGCRDMQATSKHGFWARTSLHGGGMAITPWESAPRCSCHPAEGMSAQNRAGTSYRRFSDQSWVVKAIKIRSFSKRNIPRINHSEEPKSWYVAMPPARLARSVITSWHLSCQPKLCFKVGNQLFTCNSYCRRIVLDGLN